MDFASRFNRSARYGLDLVLWSRLLASRRDPIPLDLPPALLAAKAVAHPPPALHVSGPPAEVAHWDEGFAAVYATLFLNLQMPNVLSAVRYAHPAPAFPGVYLWDSAFIAQVWKPWDLAVARDVNRAVIDLRDGDRLQHVVADLAQSAFTQPPVLAWSIAALHGGRVDAAALHYLRHVYEPLVAYNRWLYRQRRLAGGLFCWMHPYESGIDNAPRFSSRDERVLADTRPLAAPDLSAYVVLQNEALAEIAATLGREADAARFHEQAEALRARMNAYLWHEADGLYYDRHVHTGAFVRAKTIASLLPLWAGVPDAARAARLRDHLLDPAAFNTRLPLPSVARDDPAFEKDMWRGPVWINTAYAVILGLERYGYRHEAADLAFRLCEGVYRTYAEGRRLYEFYDPERHDTAELHRKRGNRWKRLTLGTKPRPEFVGWTGLVNTLVVEHLVGFRWEGGRRVLRPQFPPQAEGLGFSVRLPAEDLAISLEVCKDQRTRGTARSPAGVRAFEVAFGEAVRLDERFAEARTPAEA